MLHVRAPPRRGAVQSLIPGRSPPVRFLNNQNDASGDAVSIPSGVGHAFSATSATPARYLIASTSVGMPFERERPYAAFVKRGLMPYLFHEEGATARSPNQSRRPGVLVHDADCNGP